MKQLAWLVAFAACSHGGSDVGTAPQPGSAGSGGAPKAGAIALPTVDDASAVMTNDPHVAIVAFVDDTGAKIAVPPSSWARLASPDLAKSAKSISYENLEPSTKMAELQGADVVVASNGKADLGAVEDTATRHGAANQDDPPPPPDEDKPDDGNEESGGTGTAMALDEGKMGKKDGANKAKMAHSAARRTGAFASLVGSNKSTGWGTTAPPAGTSPDRVSVVGGEIVAADSLNRERAVLLASPTMKATNLIKAIGLSDGVIAVNQHGSVRALRISFKAPRDADSVASSDDRERWIEVRVKRDGAAIEVVPDVPAAIAFTAGKLDIKALGAAITAARAKRKLDASVPVDVLVDGDVDAQELVDALVALEAAGVAEVGLGMFPPLDQLALRGHRIPTAHFGRPKIEGGDVPNSPLRTALASHHPALLACYTTALATTPALDAKPEVAFDIASSGKVSNAKVTGVDQALGSCIASVVSTLALPKLAGAKAHVTVALTLENL